ncbi:hypothetical protein A2Z67_04420 [Candidatus Woesebacteria bacterium RBG_13_36_22]|uniref:Uncharacterized protein n=1 Tax=Candidatus Woesebacteria bacterium RBG_13_36_22 TaxID=1802478 RepID=A0A1F7X2E7_9BACT|nr:MAG: hypothetical protein A2Z67_04420 [Candidatus Woesebacteria bacterium RBG_13_36_22]
MEGMEQLWQTQTGWYKIIPYIREARGNLKCLGIQAPLCISDVNGLTIVHIRENLPYQNIIELNLNLRSIFGPATLVLALDKDIDFYKIKKCTSEEMSDYQLFGGPILEEVKDGHSNISKDERLEVEEKGRPVDAGSKSSLRRSGSKSNKRVNRTG